MGQCFIIGRKRGPASLLAVPGGSIFDRLVRRVSTKSCVKCSFARKYPAQRFFEGPGLALLNSGKFGNGHGFIVGSFQSFRRQLFSLATVCSSLLRKRGAFPGLPKMILVPCEVFGIISSLRSYAVRF